MTSPRPDAAIRPARDADNPRLVDTPRLVDAHRFYTRPGFVASHHGFQRGLSP